MRLSSKVKGSQKSKILYIKPEGVSRDSHYLVGHYVTHRTDAVYVEARCTCGEEFIGKGLNESSALQTLWALFTNHLPEE